MDNYTYVLLKINIKTGEVKMEKQLSNEKKEKEFVKEIKEIYKTLKLNPNYNKDYNPKPVPKFGYYDLSKKSYLDNKTSDRTEIRYYG